MAPMIPPLGQRTVSGGELLVWGRRTYVMGIVNVSPDSFSGDGLGDDIPAIVEQALRMEAEGADFLDVGAESTRPGHAPVTVDEELRRLIPALEALTPEVTVPVSVDTFKSVVAREALDAGATIINDQWGLQADPEIASLAAETGAGLILMHNRHNRRYKQLVPEVIAELSESADTAIQARVPEGNIILDPGFGFGKTPEHNLEVLRRLGEFKEAGYPLLGRVVPQVHHRVRAGPAGGAAAGRHGGDGGAVGGRGRGRGTGPRRAGDGPGLQDERRDSARLEAGQLEVVTAYLGLGSNLGDRRKNLQDASELLDTLDDRVRVLRSSNVYETEPWGLEDQPKFLNSVLEIAAAVPPERLLELAKQVEQTLGREWSPRYGPRLIDVDVLLFGEAVVGAAGPPDSSPADGVEGFCARAVGGVGGRRRSHGLGGDHRSTGKGSGG